MWCSYYFYTRLFDDVFKYQKIMSVCLFIVVCLPPRLASSLCAYLYNLLNIAGLLLLLLLFAAAAASLSRKARKCKLVVVVGEGGPVL